MWGWYYVVYYIDVYAISKEAFVLGVQHFFIPKIKQVGRKLTCR